MKTIYQPTIENNPFYKKSFDADFSTANNEEALKAIFGTELDKLTDLVQKALASDISLTQTAEIFYYSTFAAVLLQYKAKRRYKELLVKVPKEYSVKTMIMSQFFDPEKSMDDAAFDDEEVSDNYTIPSLAADMSKPFKYSGKLMRALTMVATMSVCTCRKNDMANALAILRDYQPVSYLLDKDRSELFPVIGIMQASETSFLAYTYSVPHDHYDMFKVVRDPNSLFCKIFADKLAQLLSQDNMDIINRARTEELRDFFLDTFVRFFFNLRSLNFPRVLSLIAAVTEHAENKSISEEVLIKIVPPECEALLGNESILSKDSVDMSSVWFKVNDGVKNFAALCNRFNLLPGYKMVLLNEVISK